MTIYKVTLRREVLTVSSDIFIEVADDTTDVETELQRIADKLINWNYLNDHDLNFREEDQEKEIICEWEQMDPDEYEQDKNDMEDEIIFRLGPFGELHELFDRMENAKTHKNEITAPVEVEEAFINERLDKLNLFERKHCLKRMTELTNLLEEIIK